MQIAKVKVFSNKAVVENRGSIVAGTIGATVLFDFDPEWHEMDGITLVWQAGEVVIDDTMATGTVPQEVLEHAGVDLKVGVYGTKEDTATPTRWANLGHIYSGADPSGDPSTDPALPVWAQADQKISLAQQAAQEARDAADDAVENAEAARAAAEEKENFVAKYNDTSHEEILEAYRAGKVCLCADGQRSFLLSRVDEEKAVFTAWDDLGFCRSRTCTAPNAWSAESESYIKTQGVSSTSTDGQIPTAAAVYRALQAAGAEPEIFIGDQDTDYANLLRQKDLGRLVFVRENTVNRRLYQHYGSELSALGLRFYRMDSQGIHWLHIAPDGTWTSGTAELSGSHEVFRADYGVTAYADVQAAADAGLLCYLASGGLKLPLTYAANGQAVFSAYHAAAGKLESAKVTADGWTNASIPAKVTESISASSTHNQLPTAKAVHSAIRAAKDRKYQLIASYEVTEPVQKIEFAGLNLDEFTLFLQAPKVETSIGHDIYVYNTAGTAVFYHWPGGTIHTDYPRNCCWHVNRAKGYVEGFYSIQTIASNSHLIAPKSSMMTHSYVDGSLPFDRIKLDTYSKETLLPVGVKVEVWGLTADE